MEPAKLIAIYARVSTARQEEEQTVLTQLSTLREFATRNSYAIVQEYTDEGWSGDMLARPALDKLRQDAKQKTWNAVLVYDPDRLARRYSYQELIMDELRDAGIELIFITVSAPKNSEDKILYGVRGLFAEYERTKIAERFRLGKLRKVKEGNILTSEPLYGYHYIPNDKENKRQGYYEINESEAAVVRMIFSWVAEEGLTQRKIVRRLRDMNIRPRKSKRGVWCTSTLSRLLGHRGYIGEAHWGKSYAVVPEKPTKSDQYRKTTKTSRKDRPEEEWYKIPISPIISEALFNKARAQITKNFELCQRNRKNQYLLAGKIFCVCGKRRAGEGPQQGKHLYYRCNGRVSSFPLPPDCHAKGINARIADSLVWDKIAALMRSPALMLQQAERSIKDRKEKAVQPLMNDQALTTELAKLRDQEDRYNRAYGAGVFSIEQLSAYLTPLREKIGTVEQHLARNRAQKNQSDKIVVPERKDLEAYAQKARALIADLSFEAKRAIVTTVIEKVVGTKEQLSVYGCIPVTADVNLYPIHRYRRSTISNDPQGHLRENEVPFTFQIEIPSYDKFYHPMPYRRRNRLGRFVSR